MDLADMRKLSDNNDYVNYLFIIDCFSRKLYVKKLKDKQAFTVLNALKTFEKYPKNLQSNQGSEFKNNLFKEFCRSNNINQFFTYNQEIKASIAERIIKSLKTLIWKYCMKYKTKRYIDVLEKIVDSYNNTYHSVIKMSPNNAENNKPITAKLNILQKIKPKESNKQKKTKFKENDYILVTKTKTKFNKGYEYENNWSDEIFKIKKIDNNFPIEMFVLVDLDNNEIEGKFYEEELQLLNLKNIKDNFLENAKILAYNIKENAFLISYNISSDEYIQEWITLRNIMQLNW